jgi:hypothetical protein
MNEWQETSIAVEKPPAEQFSNPASSSLICFILSYLIQKVVHKIVFSQHLPLLLS